MEHHDETQYAYNQKKGEIIKIVFLDGKTMKGKLLHASPLELYVEVYDTKVKNVLVYKHGVKYIY